MSSQSNSLLRRGSVYYFRRVVPRDLVPLIGKTEVKVSLATKDREEAKRRHAKLSVEIDEKWAKLRSVRPIGASDIDTFQSASSKPNDATDVDAFWFPDDDKTSYDSLSLDQTIQLARTAYTELKSEYSNRPYAQNVWDVEFGENILDFGRPSTFSIREFQAFTRCKTFVLRMMLREKIKLNSEDRFKLAKAAATAFQQAAIELKDLAKTYYRDTTPSLSASNQQLPVPFKELILGWKKEAQPSERTAREWSQAASELIVHVGYDDASRLSKDDIVKWKDDLLGRLSSKTVRDTKIAAVRVFLAWGVRNRKISTNVAEDLKVQVKKKPGQKKRGFEDSEARTILLSARTQNDPVKRWLPWLGSYTGARIAELCQLRKDDIRQEQGVWVLFITAEAGSVKNESSIRKIPLHPALIDEGFLKFVAKLSGGPIFSMLPPDPITGSRGLNGVKRIGTFVRGLGISAKSISPSHSWRHRFLTLSRRYMLNPDVVRSITGHAHTSEAAMYGEYPPEVQLQELQKIPPLDLEYQAKQVSDKDGAAGSELVSVD